MRLKEDYQIDHILNRVSYVMGKTTIITEENLTKFISNLQPKVLDLINLHVEDMKVFTIEKFSKYTPFFHVHTVKNILSTASNYVNPGSSVKLQCDEYGRSFRCVFNGPQDYYIESGENYYNHQDMASYLMEKYGDVLLSEIVSKT